MKIILKILLVSSKRELEEVEIEAILRNAEEYVELTKKYKEKSKITV